jgi:hypothetical protein
VLLVLIHHVLIAHENLGVLVGQQHLVVVHTLMQFEKLRVSVRECVFVSKLSVSSCLNPRAACLCERNMPRCLPTFAPRYVPRFRWPMYHVQLVYQLLHAAAMTCEVLAKPLPGACSNMQQCHIHHRVAQHAAREHAHMLMACSASHLICHSEAGFSRGVPLNVIIDAVRLVRCPAAAALRLVALVLNCMCVWAWLMLRLFNSSMKKYG